MTKSVHVLVVDPNDDVRGVIWELLTDLGYRVSLANGGDAMREFVDRPDPVDLIILDATTSKCELISLAIQVRDRGIRLLMISGSPMLMQEFHDHADQLLHKPFRRDALERAIELALASEVRGQRVEDPE